MKLKDLRIVTSNDLSVKSYITFYWNGKRVREYNGNNIGLVIKPNLAKSTKDRNLLLKQLEYEMINAVEYGRYPLKSQTKELEGFDIIKAIDVKYPTEELFEKALEMKLEADVSLYYKRNLQGVYRHFKEFLSKEELSNDITLIKRTRVEEFLSRYKSSGMYYMDRRRDLGVLFSVISRHIEVPLLAVRETTTMKKKAKLHKLYERQKMLAVLGYLEEHHLNLHICCLICYGCFLRPHQEIRNLKGKHFKRDCSEIHLSGDENKSGRIRVVHIPDYVRKSIIERVNQLADDENLFTMNKTVFNPAYFNTQWKRVWNKMFDARLVEKNQTIYSFRHTGAVNVYRRTKDISVVQKLLGHSDMIVTLTYLRGLGEIANDDLKECLPTL
jgi:integrase